MKTQKLAYPKLFAHRGHQSAPENTLSGVGLAKQLGATWIEVDIQLSFDNIPMIFHDLSLERTTNGTGLLTEKTLAELKLLDVGSTYSPSFHGERIPTLSELLAKLDTLQLHVNLEIKADENKLKETVIALSPVLQSSKNTQVLLSSSSIPCIKQLVQHMPNIPLALVLDEWEETSIEFAAEHCYALHLNHELITRKRLTELRKYAFKIGCYTVNTTSRAAELFELGVDGLFTDCIDQLLPLI